MNPSCKALIPVIVLATLLLAPMAHAHKVTIFAWAEGDTVHTESKFSGGKMVKHGKVEVFDKTGNRLLEGETDDNGAFSFKAPKIIDLKIELTAGMGHKNTWTLPASELAPAAATSPAPDTTPASTVGGPPALPAPPPAAGAGALTPEIVEAIVARQLDRKIAPIMHMMVAEQEKGPSVSDILGGIGYIIGLVGLGAYLRYRRQELRP
ncbi:MAG: hypothetical protein ABIL58_10040 [Pseudomonadota bacterium]